MITIPFFRELKKARHILLAGAGGGHDVYAAIPLYFILRDAGKQVSIASYTFSKINSVKTEKRCDNCSIVDFQVKTPSEGFYFPEKWLADWFHQENIDIPIYTFHHVGPAPLIKAYEDLKNAIDFDAIVLVDGGTDSLMKGDEQGIGSAAEDVSSLIAVNELNLKWSYLALIGFSVDAYDGVLNMDSLKAIDELQSLDAIKGGILLTKDMRCAKKYIQAVRFANKHTQTHQSLVENSIVSALEGNYGPQRIGGKRFATININSLMQILWVFDLHAVRNRLLYPDMREVNSLFDVEKIIKKFRANL